MHRKGKMGTLLSLLLISSLVWGNIGVPPVGGAPVISFESDRIMKKITTILSTTEKSSAHFKHGNSSLAWQWSPGGVLQIDHPIGYLTPGQSGITDRIPVFVVWIYNEKALPGKTVRFLFQTDETVNCWFDFGLDFTGWRAGWVAYDRDMQGSPQPEMDRLVIKAPSDTQGKLFFDHILFTAYTDSRFPMADHQLPYLNPKAWDHWLILYKQSQNQFDIPVNKQLTESELSNIRQIEERVYEKITPPGKSNNSDLEPIRTEYESYKIKKNSSGITGLPIWYIYHSQLYLPDNDTLKKIKSEGLDLQKYTTFMGQIARAYTTSTDPKTKNKLSEYFIHLTEHLLDQGFRSGSSTGTLSHSGYALRNFYTSFFLMKKVLTEAGLASEAQKAMEWLSGVAEVKAAPKAKGISADAFNTSVTGRLLSILMLPDTPEKATYLKAFSRYINNGLMHADGLEDFLKPDGSVFHHASLYPAYAIGGFDGATLMVWLLSHTDFAVSADAHQNLKRALLMMRLYCNLKQWPLSLSARHPNGKGELHPDHYAILALAGSPDGTEPVDTELARAYLRLSQHDKPEQFTRIFLEREITPEDNPSGNWPMNYAALAIHRRDDWLVTARGHSRYLWAAEAYIGANYYGRYITYGHLQILGSGDPVTNAASGFQMEGWDWNRWPGTTTIHLPVDQLKAQIIKPCPRSGFEEMLLSDEAFAGAIHLDNKQGAFAMKLHEHDKYNGSHRARKSVFFFDNRIICLGSDIENSVEEYPTETTLFQSHLADTKDPILLNGYPMEEFPLATTINNQQWNWISDIHNNYYFVSPGNSFILLKQHQESRHQATCEPAFGDFASAVITHGNAPKDESYEYAILVKSNPEEAARFDQSLKSSNPPYEVHQKDKNAHIVWDKETNTTAIMLFEPGNQFRSEKLLSVSAPCMVMIRENEQHLHLSVCDPDLHLYDGPADDLIIDGKRQERGVYSRHWYYNAAAPADITITIRGAWDLSKTAENCRITGRYNGNTQLTFTRQHGLTSQITLSKIE